MLFPSLKLRRLKLVPPLEVGGQLVHSNPKIGWKSLRLLADLRVSIHMYTPSSAPLVFFHHTPDIPKRILASSGTTVVTKTSL